MRARSSRVLDRAVWVSRAILSHSARLFSASCNSSAADLRDISASAIWVSRAARLLSISAGTPFRISSCSVLSVFRSSSVPICFVALAERSSHAPRSWAMACRRRVLAWASRLSPSSAARAADRARRRELTASRAEVTRSCSSSPGRRPAKDVRDSSRVFVASVRSPVSRASASARAASRDSWADA